MRIRIMLWQGMALLPLIFSPVVWSNYVHEINTHEYSIDINERGANFTEDIKFDTENNITIIHVPSHNFVDEATFLMDNNDVSIYSLDFVHPVTIKSTRSLLAQI